LQYYNQMELSPISSVEDDLIEWGKWDWGSFALLAKVNNQLLLKSISFQGIESGLYICSANNYELNNIILKGSTNSSQGCLYIYGSDQIHVYDSIVIHGINGIKIHTSNFTEIRNNIILSCNNGVINIILSHNTNIENNNIISLYDAVFNAGDSTVNIEYNNISAQIGINNNMVYSHYYNAIPTTKNNNILCTEYALFTQSLFRYEHSFDSINNYYYTQSIEEIDDLIWDRNDEDPQHIYYEYYLGIFVYNPVSYDFIQSAGLELGE